MVSRKPARGEVRALKSLIDPKKGHDFVFVVTDEGVHQTGIRFSDGTHRLFYYQSGVLKEAPGDPRQYWQF